MTVIRGDNSFILKTSSVNKSVARVITEVRDNIAEFKAEYFSDARLLRFINRAHIRVYNSVGHLFKQWFGKTTTVSLVKDQERYDLPSDFKKAFMVTRTVNISYPDKLVRVDYQDKENYRLGYYANEVYYFFEDKIGFLPVPSSNESAAITLEYLPIASELSASGDISIPQDYLELVVLWASYLATRSEEERFGSTFYRDYKELEMLLLHDYAKRDESNPDHIRDVD